jgi:hypothetical protein
LPSGPDATADTGGQFGFPPARFEGTSPVTCRLLATLELTDD